MTRDQEINKIAAELLNLKTLETQNSDERDVHELAVWSIKRALEAAYEAGRRECGQPGSVQRTNKGR